MLPHSSSRSGGNISTSPIQKLPLKIFDQLNDNEGQPRIKTILIANRGEIACRIIATCRKINIATIAIYTEPDANSLHVQQADKAVPIGPIDESNGNPHQNIELLVSLALLHKADAIHPGYGYLSENPDFAQKVGDAGLLFLGPSPQSMAVLGDKRLAKEYLSKHAPHIPLIPGYNGSEQTLDKLLVEADRIGFSILIKASAGGGGKGMRVVHRRDQLADELTRAQSEAKRSFGSSDCILERFIQNSKHIEMQIFGDSHGAVVSLLDRECSIQRRHQKVIEEAPSPWLSEDLRFKMSDAAVEIGHLLNYESAGTVEFIVDVDTAEFYFLEVNTRIQVEHPITEETTGLDIVALQIYVASGGKLDDTNYFKNKRAPRVGVAIECRLCAEDPARDFLPDLGTIRRWSTASELLTSSQTQHVRFETGIQTGSEVAIYFDSLIAKIVVWAPTRPLAISKMLKMLANTVCIGVRSNQLFLQSCLSHSKFSDVDYSTSFIPTLIPELLRNPYVEDIPNFVDKISFLPSFMKQQAMADGQEGRRRPFSSIKHGFRNQKADSANVVADVVEIPWQISQTNIIKWPGWKSKTTSNATSQMVDIIPLPQSTEYRSGDQGMKSSVMLARHFNTISREIRITKQSYGKIPLQLVKIETIKSENFARFAGDASSWTLKDLSTTVGTEHLRIYTVGNSLARYDQSAGYQTIYAHVPFLGTYLTFHLFSLLSYGQNLRSSAIDTAGDSDTKAPMPCRVLEVMKQDGDRIEIGEVGIVVESMKMEMKVSATMAGIFKACFSKGDAVDEGVVLFTVT